MEKGGRRKESERDIETWRQEEKEERNGWTKKGRREYLVKQPSTRGIKDGWIKTQEERGRRKAEEDFLENCEVA